MDDQHFMELLLILTERSMRQRAMIQGLQEKVAALTGELERLREACQRAAGATGGQE